MDKTPKKILDMTCGPRSIWFNKAHPLAVYCDIREGDFQKDFGKAHGGVKNLHVHPDVIADFRDLPFPDDTFNLVVFDPPHASRFTESSWLINSYGKLEDDWHDTIRAGVDEAMRVLVPYGTLVFKWAEVQFTTREVNVEKASFTGEKVEKPQPKQEEFESVGAVDADGLPF